MSTLETDRQGDRQRGADVSLDDRRMRQEGPWPFQLEDLVSRVRCYPGWSFLLEEGTYDDGQVSQLRLIITVRHHDSYHPRTCDRCGGTVPTRITQFHYPVPVVTWDRASWQRWIRDRAMDVHVHELGEALAFAHEGRINDRDVTYLVRPFAPHHGPGRDPNRQVEVGVDPMEARVRQDGGRYPGCWVCGVYVHNDHQHDTHEARSLCIPVQLEEETP